MFPWYPNNILIGIMLNFKKSFLLSDPERSTRWSLETVFISEPAFLDSIWIIKMQCDLVDASFFGVSLTTLLVSPIKSKLSLKKYIWKGS